MDLAPLPWLQVQVELEGSAELTCDPPPGRVVVVGPGHTFLQLAETIDEAFARWDLAHLHAFELPDGRFLGLPDDGPPLGEAPRWLDDRAVEVHAAVGPGDRFAYTFDLTASWRHACRVLEETVDPLSVFGARPVRPAIAFGWGWIPDQYSRTAAGPE
ncbi:MAG: IS1096 element passenger TnpR family protein [Conexibacter sp.]